MIQSVLRKVKIMRHLLILLYVLAFGCARDSGEFTPRPHFRLVGAQVEKPSTSTNWVVLVTGEEITKITYGQDDRTNTVIWFGFPKAVTMRLLRRLGITQPTASMTRFRVLRGDTVVAEFEYDAVNSIGGIHFRKSREEGKRILKELKR